MADKEATVYLVDIGKSMSNKSNGRSETNLEYAMQYIWDRITTTVSTGRKTLLAAVIAMKSDNTKNDQEDDESYANLEVIEPLSQILMPQLRHLQEALKPSNTDQGDPISAIVLAVMMILKECKQLKYRRRIVMITSGKGEMDADSLDDITKKISQMDIELTILGVDFDDEDFGFKEENKSKRKAHNEKILKGLAEACNGVYGTLEAAVQELGAPRVKLPRPIPSFRGQLRLGNPEQYDSAMTIDVERYPRVMVARAPTASSFVPKSNSMPETAGSSATVVGDGEMNGNTMTVVRNQYTYHVKDPDTEGATIDVQRDELAKGYEYGRTVVPISESDENITKLQTDAALELMGFIPREKYERYMGLGPTHVIIAQKTNDKAILALSSFIHALYELETCAIARLVTKDGREPQIILLAPSIEPDYECLIETQLPFAEDVRSYQFPPLDKIITVSGKVLKEHRNLPNEDLLEAMSDYVDSMDLSTFGRDDEGQPTEYMKLEDAFSPPLHRIDQAVRARAVDPAAPIGSPAAVFTKFSQPPSELVDSARSSIQTLIKAAEVKKVPPKTKGRKRNRDFDKPISGLDVDNLLSSRRHPDDTKRVRISPDNAIPEFKQQLVLTADIEAVRDLVKQFARIVEDRISASFGDQHYDRAIEELGVMRHELIDYEEGWLWNETVREIKRKILGGELGGERKEMWWLMRRNRLGLVQGTSDGEVGEEEAREFLAGK